MARQSGETGGCVRNAARRQIIMISPILDRRKCFV